METRARFALTVLVTALTTAALPAQIATSTDVAFEVASVKPNNSGATNSSTSGRQGAFTATNVTVGQLIIYAFRLRQFQLDGGPGWMSSDRFDILARPPENVKQDNPAMTRALLRDRFKLVVHTETRQEQVYALVLARADGSLGPSIKTSSVNCANSQPGATSPCGINTSVSAVTGRVVATGQTMEQLAAALGSFGLSRMVLERTGLKGLFDFELRWTTDTSTGVGAPPSNDAPSIFAALQEQLGLKLESERGPVEFLVVDNVERPTPD